MNKTITINFFDNTTIMKDIEKYEEFAGLIILYLSNGNKTMIYNRYVKYFEVSEDKTSSL